MSGTYRRRPLERDQVRAEEVLPQNLYALVGLVLEHARRRRAFEISGNDVRIRIARKTAGEVGEITLDVDSFHAGPYRCGTWLVLEGDRLSGGWTPEEFDQAFESTETAELRDRVQDEARRQQR